MGEADIASAIGRLEGTLVARLDEHGRALKTVADEVAKQGRRLDDLEKERESIRKTVTRSAHDLSEHVRHDEATNEAIKRHISQVDKRLAELNDATIGQNDVLKKQDRVLGRIDRLHPIIILVATALGAAISGYIHAGISHESEQPAHVGETPHR